jgi:hypothetical protein
VGRLNLDESRGDKAPRVVQPCAFAFQSTEPVNRPLQSCVTIMALLAKQQITVGKAPTARKSATRVVVCRASKAADAEMVSSLRNGSPVMELGVTPAQLIAATQDRVMRMHHKSHTSRSPPPAPPRCPGDAGGRRGARNWRRPLVRRVR